MAIKKGKWISVSEAVSILGLSDKTIRRRIKSGIMTSKKVGRSYVVFIPDETIEEETKQEEQLKEKKTTEQPTNLLEVLIKQLDEKDKLIKELNERIREAHVLASGRLLGNGKQEQDEGEVIYATGNISEESENVVTQPTKEEKKKPFNWKPVLYILGTLGLSAIVYLVITNLDYFI